MTFTKRNEVTEIKPADFNGIWADRGVDLDTGRYYAVVNGKRWSGFSSIVRDQWFNAAMAEAVKARDDAKRQSLHAKLFEEIVSKDGDNVA